MSKIINTNDFPVKSRPSLRKAALISGIVIGVVLLGFGVYAIMKAVQKDDVPETTQVCSPELIKRASKKIEASDITGVQAVKGEIEKLKTHERDANCQYILVRYALMVKDIEDAKAQLAQYKKVYVALSPAFGTRTYTPADLEAILKDVEDAKKTEDEQGSARQSESSDLDSLADRLGPGGAQ